MTQHYTNTLTQSRKTSLHANHAIRQESKNCSSNGNRRTHTHSHAPGKDIKRGHDRHIAERASSISFLHFM